MTSCAAIALKAWKPTRRAAAKHVENSTAAATALVPALGYERAGEAAKLAQETGPEHPRNGHRARLADRRRI